MRVWKVLAVVVTAFTALTLSATPTAGITPSPPLTTDNIPRNGFAVCVAGFGANQAAAEDRVDEAITEWETVAGLLGGDAIAMTREAACDTDNVHIVPAGGIAVAAAFNTAVTTSEGVSDEGAIGFNTTINWQYGNVAPAGDEYSFLGIVTHELGHILGESHVGNWKWSPQDGKAPTMTDVGGIGTNTWWVRSIQADEWGLGVWVQSFSGSGRWNADPGFESYSTYWTKIGPNPVAGPEGKRTGLYGAKLWNVGDGMKARPVYDPWIYGTEVNIDPVTGDPQNDDIFASSWYKYAQSGAAIGLHVEVRYRYYLVPQWIDLDHDEVFEPDEPDNEPIVQKHFANVGSPTAWTSWVREADCDPDTTWTLCTTSSFTLPKATGFVFEAPNWQFEAAMYQVQVRFVNVSNKKVYLDEAGIYGGFPED